MHNHVYEKESLYNLFLHHLGKEGEHCLSYFKDRLSDKLVWLDGSTNIYDLSNHKEDIRKIKIGYDQRKRIQDIYLAKVERVLRLLTKFQRTSMLKIKNKSRVMEKVILLQQIALLM